MAYTFKLAEAVIQLSVNGAGSVAGKIGGSLQSVATSVGSVAGKINSELDKVHSVASAVGRALGAMGAAGKASLIGMAAVASPVAFQQFQWAIRDLAGTIGLSLVPYLRQLTSVIRGLADKFYSLDPATRATIAKLAVMATTAGLVAGALPLLTSGLQTVGVAIRAITSIMAGFNVATGGVLIIVGSIVTGLAALGAYLFTTNDGMKSFANIFAAANKVLDQFKTLAMSVVDALMPAFAGLGAAITMAMESLGRTLSKMMPTIERVVLGITSVFDALVKHISQSIAVISVMMDVIADSSLMNPTNFAAEIGKRFGKIQSAQQGAGQAGGTGSKAPMFGGQASYTSVGDVTARARQAALMAPQLAEQRAKEENRHQEAQQERKKANDLLTRIAGGVTGGSVMGGIAAKTGPVEMARGMVQGAVESGFRQIDSSVLRDVMSFLYRTQKSIVGP